MACKVEIDGVEIPSEKGGKCLGYWWQGDLFAKKAVEENVMKARRSFLMYPMGAFQGDLSPLSTRSVIETCVVPVLLYGCENWILSDMFLKLFVGRVSQESSEVAKIPFEYGSDGSVGDRVGRG